MNKEKILKGRLGDDKLIISPKLKKVFFSIYCDNAGFSVDMDKEELRELLK